MRVDRNVCNAVAVAAISFVCAAANATPPVGGRDAPAVQVTADGTVVIGRVLIRGQAFDLSTQTIAAGGVASELATGVAQPQQERSPAVQADIDVKLMRRESDTSR